MPLKRVWREALPGLLESAHCVVSNDSGPMHLAAALGRPLVGLFGPTSPRRFGPYPRNGEKQRVLAAPGGDLSGISVDRVVEAVREVL